MTGSKSNIRGGRGSLRAYIYVGTDMIAFLEQVFGADITARHETPFGFHVEAMIGDTPLTLEAGEGFPESVQVGLSSLYLYVEDVDAVYEKAMARGATSISPPEDKPYKERQCGIKDLSGNTWWIATSTDKGP